jgi:hypothetical protein
MELDILDTDVYYMNSYKSKIRDYHMRKQLSSFKTIHRVEAIPDKVKYNGVSMAHLITLLKGYRAQKPFIVLEDDVTISYIPTYPIILPYKPKALYLGNSTWGYKVSEEFNTAKYDAQYEIIDDTFYRPISMYGGHATLYFDMEYVKKVIKLIEEAIIINKPHDIYLPVFQQHYKLLGLRNPLFYQDARIGGQEEETKIIF